MHIHFRVLQSYLIRLWNVDLVSQEQNTEGQSAELVTAQHARDGANKHLTGKVHLNFDTLVQLNQKGFIECGVWYCLLYHVWYSFENLPLSAILGIFEVFIPICSIYLFGAKYCV